MPDLTATTLEVLLSSLDADDQTRAAEKYELLRLKLVKCLTWRKYCPEKLPPFTKDDNAPLAHPFFWSPFVLIGNWK